MVGIIKELRYKRVRIILYKDPTFGMFTLNDDKYAYDIANLCKVHLGLHMHVQLPLSQPEYFGGRIEDETINPNDVVIFDE